MTVINTVVSVRVYTSSPSSLRDPLFHLCRVQSRAPGAMQILSLFSKTFSLSGFRGAAACPCPPAGVGGDESGLSGVERCWVLFLFSVATLFALEWSYSVSVSLTLNLWWGDGKPSPVRDPAGAGWPSPSRDNLSPWQQAEAPRDSDRLWNPWAGLSRIT